MFVVSYVDVPVVTSDKILSRAFLSRVDFSLIFVTSRIGNSENSLTGNFLCMCWSQIFSKSEHFYDKLTCFCFYNYSHFHQKELFDVPQTSIRQKKHTMSREKEEVSKLRTSWEGFCVAFECFSVFPFRNPHQSD